MPAGMSSGSPRLVGMAGGEAPRTHRREVDGMSDALSPARRLEYEELVFEHLGSMQAFALRLSRDPAEADDLVQETCLRAYRFFDRFERGTNVKAWLFRILKNTFINAYRQKRTRPHSVDFDDIAGGYEQLIDDTRVARLQNPEEALGEAVMLKDVEAGLAEMPEEYRLVVHLCLLEGFTYQESADTLDIPVGTVMSRLHRGRKFLQARLVEHARSRGLVADEREDPAAAPERGQS